MYTYFSECNFRYNNSMMESFKIYMCVCVYVYICIYNCFSMEFFNKSNLYLSMRGDHVHLAQPFLLNSWPCNRWSWKETTTLSHGLLKPKEDLNISHLARDGILLPFSPLTFFSTPSIIPLNSSTSFLTANYCIAFTVTSAWAVWWRHHWISQRLSFKLC